MPPVGKYLDRELQLISRGNSIYFQRYEHVYGGLTIHSCQVPTKLLYHFSSSTGQGEKISRRAHG